MFGLSDIEIGNIVTSTISQVRDKEKISHDIVWVIKTAISKAITENNRKIAQDLRAEGINISVI